MNWQIRMKKMIKISTKHARYYGVYSMVLDKPDFYPLSNEPRQNGRRDNKFPVPLTMEVTTTLR